MTVQKNTYSNVPRDRPRLDEVPEAYRGVIDDLFDTWNSVAPRNNAIRRYYEMKNEMKNLGISIPPQCEHVNSVVGWCSKAIAAHANRSKFDAFLFAGREDANLKRQTSRNRMRSLYQDAVKSALTYGMSTMTVMRGRRDGDVVVRVFSANQSCAIWDKDANRIKAGIVLGDTDRNGKARKYVVHTADAVLTLERGRAKSANPTALGDYQWSCAVEPHMMGRPLMEAFVHDPDPDRPLGHSMITPELMGIVDKAMRDVLRMEVGAEFFTAPQRYILGASEDLFSAGVADDGEPAPASPSAKWQAYLGSFLALTRDENGEVPQVGQFASGSASNFTAVFENDAQRFSGATNVPLAQLGVLSNNYTSSDALNATDNPLILEVEVMNDRNAETMQEVARMMMAVAGDVPMDALSDDQQDVQALFTNPAMPTIAARADAMTKFASVDGDFAGTDVYYEGCGFSHPTIDRIKAEKEAKTVTAAMGEIAAAIAGQAAQQPEQPGD